MIKIAKLSLEHAYLIKIEAKLPNGEVTLWELLPKIKKYQVTPVQETIKYRTTGDGVPEHFEMMLWIAPEDYQPLANRLGKIGIKPRPVITRINSP